MLGRTNEGALSTADTPPILIGCITSLKLAGVAKGAAAAGAEASEL